MYVVGYPKSGNTWLCFLLAYCLNAEFDDLDAPGIYPKNEYQRRYVKGGLAHISYQNQVGKILKTHRQEFEGMSSDEPFVYLIRDGRDVMVSYYFFRYNYIKYLNARSPQNFKQLLLKIRNVFNSSSDFDISHQDFSSFLRQYTDEWITHVLFCLNRQPTAVIRYEDLKSFPVTSLNRLFEQLNVQVADEVIQQGLAIFDFKQLSQRQEGEEDRNSFFRKGIVGDWQNHFSPDDLEFFYQKASKIMRRADYDL